jgi:LPXTG-site transpeptidase (sortase) family protein
MFGSAHFRKVFLIRFMSFELMIWGFLILILVVEPVITEEGRYQLDQLLGNKHTLGPKIVTSADQTDPGVAVAPVNGSGGSSLGSVLSGGSNVITPVSTDFGIVIEKINANARVVANVDPGSETEYSQALGLGVAHAKGTVFPGQKGNIYLFSHSVDAPWNIIRYNAVFYLLNKLERGDSISMFFKGRRYDYVVYDKVIANPSDTQYLTNKYDDSILTLQTCDPPGTLLNRLLIRARLETR